MNSESSRFFWKFTSRSQIEACHRRETTVTQAPEERLRNGTLMHARPLLPTQKANAPCKCPMLSPAESQKLRRVHVVIHKAWILPVGHIVEACAQSEVVTKQSEASLDVCIQCEISRETVRVEGADQLLLF